MNQQLPYSKSDIRRATNLSAFLGWTFFCAPAAWANPFLLPWLAVIGLPISYILCWAFGAPILHRLARKPITWVKAALGGATIAALMAILSILIGRFNGWRISQNPNFSSTLGGGEFVRSFDGILTPYGWWVLAQNTFAFVLLGMCVGLLVRAMIGKGKVSSNDPAS